jgi:alkene monooxygenase reductase
VVGVSAQVVIQPFGAAIDVEGGESVLAAVLRSGRYLTHGCKHGGCGTCRARLVDGECRLGEQTSYALSDADRAAGMLLLCSTYLAADAIAVDVSDTMDLTEAEFAAGHQVTEHDAMVERVDALTHDIRRVGLRLVDPPQLRFIAGQHVEVEVPGSGGQEWRAFSIASPPGEAGRVDLIIKIFPGGRFSTALDRHIKPGWPLRLRGPAGQFRVMLSHRPMVMIAGGSGLAPIRSMLHHLVTRGNERPVTFFFGARTDRDLFLLDELSALERAHAWFRFVPAVSEPERCATPWPGASGLITDVARQRLDSLRGYEAYLCGPPRMVDAAIEVLLAKGCKPRHIVLDRFVPTGLT